ncbi:MAG: MATE family efflux transporter [Clostridia bacterium]|nr:MATE family efflux transporter [Clostridia bacterium]
MAKQETRSKFERMTTEPVEKLVTSLAVPTIIGMLITAFYNMADTFFVGQIGTSATAAVGVAFSLQALIQALGFLFGQGSGNFISRMLGAQNEEDAGTMASVGFFSGILSGVLIAVISLIFIKPICMILGSTETILPYAVEYLTYILLCAPITIGSFVLNNQMRFQGNAAYAVIGLATGSILNIALDPLFIFVFRLGVSGAAIATALSQLISFCILIYMNKTKAAVPVSIKHFRLDGRIYKEIVRGGIPSFARQSLASVSTIMLNTMAGKYGADAAIAGMSVVTRISMFASSVVIGFGQGFQPVCGFNYGAKLYERVKKAFWFCVKFATVFLAIAGIIMFIFAPEIIAIFRKDDPEVIRIGAFALRCQCVTLFLTATVVMSNMMLQTIGMAVPATIVAMSRQFIFFIPLLFILGAIFRLTGIMMTQAVADVCAFALSLPIVINVMKKMHE